MTKYGEADAAARAIGLRALGRTILSRFEGLVCPKIVDSIDRGRQALWIGGLVGAGLIAVLAAPVAQFAGLGFHVSTLSLGCAGLCLAAASWLAATGRLESVIAAVTAASSLAVALAAIGTGGAGSPMIWLLVMAPAEALASGRRTLCGLAAGLACFAFGLVGLAQWFELTSPPLGAGLVLSSVCILILHGASIARRLHRSQVGRWAKDALKIAEAKLVEDRLSEAVLRFAPDGRLVSASGAAETLFGPQAAPLDAETLFSRIHVVDRVPYLKAFGDLRAGIEPPELEVRMQVAGLAPQAHADIQMRFLAVRGPAGALVSTLVAVRDVTLERRRTSELGNALDEARKVSDAKTQFLAAVSHELRTPLNAIIGFSDVLDQEFFGGFENPRQKEYVGLIRQSGEHLLSVVNGLLDVSKIEAGRYDLHCERFAIGAALAAAAKVLRSEAERKGLCLDLRDLCGAVEIVADKRAFHQILLNLLSNAVKFTERGVVTLEAFVEGGVLVASVCDTGIGIRRQEILRLGQPFTQVSSGLSRQYQGTGLGLSLVKGLTELHHGTMDIASEFGRGTRVTVRLPIEAEETRDEDTLPNETIVSLTHARKQTGSNPRQAEEERRTA